MGAVNAEKVISELRRLLGARSDVNVALLFGSFARGAASERSDVDVALDAPGVDRLALAADLSIALGREVDVVDLHAAGIPLLDALVRDGIVVHEGRPGAAARWRTRALIDLDTDRSWYTRMSEAYLRRLARGSADG